MDILYMEGEKMNKYECVIEELCKPGRYSTAELWPHFA